MTRSRVPELTFAIATEDEVMQMVDEGFRLAEHQDNLKVFQMGNRELITKAFLDGIQDEKLITQFLKQSFDKIDMLE